MVKKKTFLPSCSLVACLLSFYRAQNSSRVKCILWSLRNYDKHTSMFISYPHKKLKFQSLGSCESESRRFTSISVQPFLLLHKGFEPQQKQASLSRVQELLPLRTSSSSNVWSLVIRENFIHRLWSIFCYSCDFYITPPWFWLFNFSLFTKLYLFFL